MGRLGPRVGVYLLWEVYLLTGVHQLHPPCWCSEEEEFGTEEGARCIPVAGYS